MTARPSLGDVVEIRIEFFMEVLIETQLEIYINNLHEGLHHKKSPRMSPSHYRLQIGQKNLCCCRRRRCCSPTLTSYLLLPASCFLLPSSTSSPTSTTVISESQKFFCLGNLERISRSISGEKVSGGEINLEPHLRCKPFELPNGVR